MSKKRYASVRLVREFMSKQPTECQARYVAMVDRLEQDGYLIEPFAKKLEANLFELRVRRGRQVRVFYCYDAGDMIVGVHAFLKKTQKTPGKEIRQARRVVSAILRGTYHE